MLLCTQSLLSRIHLRACGARATRSSTSKFETRLIRSFLSVGRGPWPEQTIESRRDESRLGCHEETVRRAYLRGLLVSQRFGVRGRRFHPRDVLDWIARGAPTRIL